MPLVGVRPRSSLHALANGYFARCLALSGACLESLVYGPWIEDSQWLHVLAAQLHGRCGQAGRMRFISLPFRISRELPFDVALQIYAPL